MLITNLKQNALSRYKASALYFQRWGIEAKLDTLKNKRELENISVRSAVTT